VEGYEYQTGYEVEDIMGSQFNKEQKKVLYISNNLGFRLKHPGVPAGSDGSDRTSYPLTENYTLPVTQATGRVSLQSTWERQQQTCEYLGAP